MKQSWLKVKNQVLGKDYDLSFSFVSSGEMGRLNKKYRKKNYAADVLSFSLEKNSGEILINKTYQNKKRADYLFIHSLLHLGGLRHGLKMDKWEMEICSHFSKSRSSL